MVWVYLRLSRDEEHDPKVLDNHRAQIQALLARDGVTVPADAWHAEIGSADHIEDRPVFLRLLGAWERLPRNSGGSVYTTEVSRLTRGLQSQQGRVQDALARAGIVHVTRNRAYDLRRSDDCTAWELAGFIARMENRNFRDRVMGAWDVMLAQGLIRNGRAPFGYVWSKDEENLLPHDAEFPILTRCCHEALETSVQRLAARYHVPQNNLLRALRNPTICGWPALRHGPRPGEAPRRGRYSVMERERWRWPEVENTRYPHACTREEWERLQLAIDARRHRAPRTGYQNGWCRDVVQFVALPGPCRLGLWTGSGHKALTYEREECHGTSRGKRHYVARETVHAAAQAAMERAFADPPALLAAIQAYETQTAKLAPADQAETIAADLKRTRGRYQEAVDAEYDATSPALRLALQERRLRLEAEVERLEALLHTANLAPGPPVDLSRLKEQLPRLGHCFPSFFATLSERERRDLVNHVIKALWIVTEKLPGVRAWKREVDGGSYQPWIPAPWPAELAK